MLGRYHPVRADIVSIDLSTHADRSELLDWLATADGLDAMYVNHGEQDAAEALASSIRDRLGVLAVAPHQNERVVVTR